jgi:voltage-gated potassium channel
MVVLIVVALVFYAIHINWVGTLLLIFAFIGLLNLLFLSRLAMWFQKIKRIVEKSDTVAGKSFDLFIQTMIVISLISFSIETIPNLSGTTKNFLSYIEGVTVSIFTVEYLLRLFVAERKFRFVFSFYGIIDLCAILPFYLSLGIDLRSIRILRLLRLFRILKMLRYSKAIRRFKLAFESIKEEMVLFFITTLFLIYLASVGIYYCESNAQPDAFKSIFHCLWWSIVTLTTVGYGDVYPVTVPGKIFAAFVMMIGIGVVAVPSGLLASALGKTIRDEEHANKDRDD